MYTWLNNKHLPGKEHCCFPLVKTSLVGSGWTVYKEAVTTSYNYMLPSNGDVFSKSNFLESSEFMSCDVFADVFRNGSARIGNIGK